ncbi:MAG TPA: glycosyltransferase family 2 protein [Candidatus Paceibacterota bacterium]|nr:glycosyltransferase family 2 protein [Candidatus Paceibacterota bacterium]
MNRAERRTYAVLFIGGLIVTSVFAVWWFEPSHIAHNFSGPLHFVDVFSFIVLSYIVWHQIVMEVFGWCVADHIRYPRPPGFPPLGLRVAYVTAFVPQAEPYSILVETLKAMVAVDYPHDTWLLDEGNDPTAKAICEKYGVIHYSRNGKNRFNTISGKFKRKTKGGNYNSWLHHFDTKYDIVVQHDVDFIPRKDFLLRTLGYFKDPQVGFVETPQVYGNLKESWIARGAAEQTWGFYGFFQKGFFGQDMTLLIGANHIFRTSAWRDIEGYTAHITEDMLTGMKMYTRTWKSVYVPEVLLIGEGPSTWPAYFKQQMRWSYGCMDILIHHSPQLLPKMGVRKLLNYFLLQQFYFDGLAQALGIGLLTAYFVGGVSPANIPLLPILFLWVPIMIYQIAFQIWLQRFNIDAKNERGLLIAGRLLFIAVWPIYFLSFIGVILGRQLSYTVTPKGKHQKSTHDPTIFLIHFIFGSITLIDVVIGAMVGRFAGQLVFWALLNTVFMYGFFFSEALLASIEFISQRIRGIEPYRALRKSPVTIESSGWENRLPNSRS